MTLSSMLRGFVAGLLTAGGLMLLLAFAMALTDIASRKNQIRGRSANSRIVPEKVGPDFVLSGACEGARE